MRRGLAETRAAARAAIDAGLVTVDGGPVRKASTQVAATQDLVVHAPPRRYVSRGGDKLDAALSAFGVDPAGRHCLDAGISTGGFTDCLLQHGATRVVGVDVGYGQVHERLRTDDRVTVLERTNVRRLRPDQVPPPAPDLVVVDVSFISLRLVLAPLREAADPRAEAVLLVKPQFEAGREEVGGGVVRDPEVWRRTIVSVGDAAATVGWGAAGVAPSPRPGPAGNVEFLLHLVPGGTVPDLPDRIEAAVRAGRELTGDASAAPRERLEQPGPAGEEEP